MTHPMLRIWYAFCPRQSQLRTVLHFSQIPSVSACKSVDTHEVTCQEYAVDPWDQRNAIRVMRSNPTSVTVGGHQLYCHKNSLFVTRPVLSREFWILRHRLVRKVLEMAKHSASHEHWTDDDLNSAFFV